MSYELTDAGEADMRAELKVLNELNDEIDQLAATARGCDTLCPEAATLLNLAWWFAEHSIRETNGGSCSMGHARNAGRCGTCDLYNTLRTQAERIGRQL